MHDFGARVSALRLVGSPASRFAPVDDAVGDDVVLFLLDFDETHLEDIYAIRASSADMRPLGSGCDRPVIRATINVGLRSQIENERCATSTRRCDGRDVLQCKERAGS